MNQYSKFVTLTGGILAFFCFALPWESNYSGLYLANGHSGIITTIFIVSLVVIITNIYLISIKSNINPLFITIALIIGLIGTYVCLVVFTENRSVNFNIVTMSMFASLIIICTAIYMLNRRPSFRSVATIWIVVCSIVGFCCFLVLIFGETLNIKQNDIQIVKVKYGASLTAVGFILAIVGVLCFPSKEKYTETHRATPSEEISVGEEE